MNILTKTGITLLAMAAITGGSLVHAQENEKISQLDREELRELRESGDREAFKSRIKELGLERKEKPELTDDQKETIKELRESGDRDAIKNQLNDWGIEKSNVDRKGLRKEGVFESLSDEQKQEIQDLRESEADKEVIREKLSEFGVELPKRVEITDEQKEKIQELREAGNKEELKEYFQEIGISKKRVKMQKRKAFSSSLTEDEKEVLKEARDIARAGDKDIAREMIEEVFEANDEIEKPERGIFRFFKRLF